MTVFHGKHLPNDIDTLTRNQTIELCKIQFDQTRELMKEIDELEAELEIAAECIEESGVDYDDATRHLRGLI